MQSGNEVLSPSHNTVQCQFATCQFEFSYLTHQLCGDTIGQSADFNDDEDEKE